MNIIVAGGGKVGSMLTRQLSLEGHDITVIDSDSQVLTATVERYDIISVHGIVCASLLSAAHKIRKNLRKYIRKTTAKIKIK